ncbi:hypothetical protein [Terrabacter sp. MAHUQ-38]|uniref:hypothetical protein n=1 Tax=unclassified Terrabacter TaxID=2630222 RepID=UPI00165E0F3F|nr:hypothetical protein [Terrabacter sp. MAHUQ-38]MBC9821628.1 hypothetical protein [Terrabacter sp. MAHUQ-38]
MSDLQCAARIIVVNPPGLADVAWLASAIHLEKIQAVYAAADVPDSGPVESLADDLGVPSHLSHGDLRDGSAGFDELVDRHRGETVVVVRGGSAPQPLLLLVDADGSTEQPIDGLD